MKKLLLFSVLIFALAVYSTAQSDTLLFEDFQDELDVSEFPDPDIIDQWQNLDMDGIAPDPSSGITSGAWYWSEDFENFRLDTIVGDTNLVFASNSWLTNFDPNNRNWLVTPAIAIVDDQATLHFKCAPYQLPRYMDRITVMVSTGINIPDGWSSSNPDQPGDFEEIVFRSAEMTEITGNGQSTDLSNFSFSAGYFHANMMTDSSYFIVEDSTLNWGTLEPHSVSLSGFENKQIFIGFVHDSSDDYRMMVDDILVMGNEGVLGVEDPLAKAIRFVTYPNPVDNFMNVLFRIERDQQGQIDVLDGQGKVVWSGGQRNFSGGEQNHTLDLRGLPSGSYVVRLRLEDQFISKSFIRH
jgi:hypothetical protein